MTDGHRHPKEARRVSSCQPYSLTPRQKYRDGRYILFTDIILYPNICGGRPIIGMMIEWSPLMHERSSLHESLPRDLGMALQTCGIADQNRDMSSNPVVKRGNAINMLRFLQETIASSKRKSQAAFCRLPVMPFISRACFGAGLGAGYIDRRYARPEKVVGSRLENRYGVCNSNEDGRDPPGNGED
ncbi:hypothetical protein BJV78DRAFT_69310 [Lactifluus subvellereus]|nr:hypothetical protein BJV78DRAFT_69310 [Lactifluus subvellereus]